MHAVSGYSNNSSLTQTFDCSCGITTLNTSAQTQSLAPDVMLSSQKWSMVSQISKIGLMFAVSTSRSRSCPLNTNWIQNSEDKASSRRNCFKSETMKSAIEYHVVTIHHSLSHLIQKMLLIYLESRALISILSIYLRINQRPTKCSCNPKILQSHEWHVTCSYSNCCMTFEGIQSW